MWPSHNVLNWYTSNWLLFNIYVDGMAVFHTTVVKLLSENKTPFKIAALGLQVCVKIGQFLILSEIPCTCLQEN